MNVQHNVSTIIRILLKNVSEYIHEIEKMWKKPLLRLLGKKFNLHMWNILHFQGYIPLNPWAGSEPLKILSD